MMLLDIVKFLSAAQVQLKVENGNLSLQAPKGIITAEILAAIKQYKAEILEYFGNVNHEALKIIPVARTTNEGLSFAQQRLWLLDKIEGGSTHYNLPSAFTLTGDLHLVALEKSFTAILARHESLRTCFGTGLDGEPYQIILPPSDFIIQVTDLCDLTIDMQQQALDGVIKQEITNTFDLSKDVMLRVRLVHLSRSKYVLLVTMHHIASDGWSMSIIINEFVALYSAYTQHCENPLSPLAIQYADYAHWQREYLKGDMLKKQLDYWQKQLLELPNVHSLPTDYSRPIAQTFNGASYCSCIEKNITEQLLALCHAHDATLFMGLHAAFSTLLSRYSNSLDIVVGSPIANREQPEIAGLIGYFVNTLVLRNRFSPDINFIELLQQSKQMLLDAYAYQQVPFEQIIERVKPQRSLSYSPLFQVMLVLQNNENIGLQLPGLSLEPVVLENSAAKYDITLNVTEGEKGLELTWEFNTDLFFPATIERMAAHFNQLLQSVLLHPKAPVFTVNLLSDAERHQVQIEWNKTQIDYPKDSCIHEFFEAQAATNPNAVAVIFEQQQLTYFELNEQANRLAHYLRDSRCMVADKLVGICLERSSEMVICILAILKAGGAYVPLDPDYPPARLSYLLQDTKLDTVLSQGYLVHGKSLPITAQQLICLDDVSIQQELLLRSSDNLTSTEADVSSHHLAYVIYTSGSTGNPKGVMVEHNALVNRIDWMQQHYGCGPGDRILQKTPFSFDVSVWEFMWPLSYGAALVLAKPEGHKDPEYLSQLIASQQISHLHFVPSMLASMLSLGDLGSCPKLRFVFCSGEALAVKHVQDFQAQCPHSELHNLYGPTEAAIDVSYWDCSQMATDTQSIPIGRPIHNIQLYILNSRGELAPRNVAGELHIGGIGLARGYLHRQELTAEKFITNPFYDSTNPSSSKRLYKTGDLARWLPDGNVEFLGRIDHQVKIRGFRIELGEIEHALNSHEWVNDAVVLAKESLAGDKRLVAYLVAEKTENLIDTLRRDLSQSLPDYMVPSAFVVLDNFPLTPNGKLDRQALPEPDVIQYAAYDPPVTNEEIIIASLWADMFGIKNEKITKHANFFHIGGDSLSALKFKSIAAKHGLFFTIKEIIGLQTISALACIPSLTNRTNPANDIVKNSNNSHGNFLLLPEQRWFFSENYENPHHFNIAQIIELDIHLDVAIAKVTLQHVMAMHEGLTSSFMNGVGRVMLTDTEIQKIPFFDYDLSNMTVDEQNEFIENCCIKAQSAFDISSGQLFCFNYFNVGPSRRPLFFYAFHHLLCDHQSLEIIYEDFQEIYMDMMSGSVPKIQKTYSFQEICEFVNNVGKDKEKVDYWSSQPWTIYHSYKTDLECDRNGNIVSSARQYELSLTEHQTEVLLDVIFSKWELPLADVLLYALAESLRLINTGDFIPIWHVASGRSFIANNADIDMSRAVGWFAMPSVRFVPAGKGASVREDIASLSTLFKSIPDAGCSYLPCAYSEYSQKKINLFPDEDKVVFNHIGFTTGGAASSPLPAINLPENPSNYRSCLFKCITSISNGQLKIFWEYSQNQYQESTIENLAHKFLNILTTICANNR